LVVTPYDVAVTFNTWRNNPAFLGAIMISADLPPNLMGDFHLSAGSPAKDAGAAGKGAIAAPATDIDRQGRPAGTGFDIGADEVPVPASADLAIAKTDGQATVTAGGAVAYTITVTNNGPDGIVGAIVTDVLPAQLTSVSWTCTPAASCIQGGGGYGTGNINANKVTLNLANGGSAIFAVTATVSPVATGTLVNTATVAVPAGATDPGSGNNSATDTDTILVPVLPAVGLLDNFTRANAANLGANWIQPNNNIRLNANQANENNGNTGFAYWNSPSTGYGAKQGAAFTIANTTLAGDSLILKATLGTATAPQNYVRVRLTASTVVVETTVNGGGNFPNAGTLNNANSTFLNGDVLTAQVDATGLVSVWRTRVATTVFVGSVPLPSSALWTTGGGRIGMSLPNGARVDNFSGGTLP
jgi:uncharacterized repeat protein (TIGR01451 family)